MHNKIRYRLDTLKPWGYEEFIHEHDCKEKYQKWETEKEYTYNDYYKIIEGKQSLFMEFEKLIDSRLKNIYLIRLNTDLKEKEKIKAKTTKLEDLISQTWTIVVLGAEMIITMTMIMTITITMKNDVK